MTLRRWVTYRPPHDDDGAPHGGASGAAQRRVERRLAAWRRRIATTGATACGATTTHCDGRCETVASGGDGLRQAVRRRGGLSGEEHPRRTAPGAQRGGQSATVAQAVGQPLDQVRQLQVEAIGWDAAADELRTLLKAIESASIVRRERLAFIGSQAYLFGSQLAKDPANADLLPQVEEIKRLKALARRKKTQPAPQQ